jgi:multidrug efflux pump subunit AcrA (membrane-fusion protein)
VPNPDATLRAGTAVQVSISGKTVPKALLVPSESLVTNPAGNKAVMVIGSDGIAHLKEVLIGIEDHGMTQVVSGISVGDRVVTQGAYGLDDGTKVKVVTGTQDDTGKPKDSD